MPWWTGDGDVKAVWKLDEDAGAGIMQNEVQPSYYMNVLGGVTQGESGRIGKSALFNPATSDYAATHGQFQTMFGRTAIAPITVGAWFKKTDAAGALAQRLFTVLEGDLTTAMSFGVASTPDDRVLVILGRTGASYEAVAASGDGVNWTDGAWHKFDFTFDGTDCKIYWHGLLIATGTPSPAIDAVFSRWSWIGTFSASAGFFSGWIDELYICDAVKDAAWILNRYNDDTGLHVGGDTWGFGRPLGYPIGG